METPLNIRVINAKSELRGALMKIGSKYDLPGVVMDLIVSEVLADERQAHLGLIAGQFAQATEKKGDTNGDT